jgi:hypothetical protein
MTRLRFSYVAAKTKRCIKYMANEREPVHNNRGFNQTQSTFKIMRERELKKGRPINVIRIQMMDHDQQDGESSQYLDSVDFLIF